MTNITDKQLTDFSCFDLNHAGFAFAGYATAGFANAIPGARSVAIAVLENLIDRMISPDTWMYVAHYWGPNGTNPHSSFPDPVAFQNIMYSGHVAQMMTLYESISGDLTKYSVDGWNFVYLPTQERIHYTLPKLYDVIVSQVETNPSGGVACEPYHVFPVGRTTFSIGG